MLIYTKPKHTPQHHQFFTHGITSQTKIKDNTQIQQILHLRCSTKSQNPKLFKTHSHPPHLRNTIRPFQLNGATLTPRHIRSKLRQRLLPGPSYPHKHCIAPGLPQNPPNPHNVLHSIHKKHQTHWVGRLHVVLLKLVFQHSYDLVNVEELFVLPLLSV